MTASLESFAEAPEIEKMLHEYILPTIQADHPVAKNSKGYARLQAALETAANPVRPGRSLPGTALNISGSAYTFGENPPGWKTLEFVFEQGSKTAQFHLNDYPAREIGLDNIYRLSTGEPLGDLFLRGRWTDEQTFLIDYPYPANGNPILGELGEKQFQFKFTGDKLSVTIAQIVFGGEPIVFEGTR